MNSPFLNNANSTQSVTTDGLTDEQLRASSVAVVNSTTQLVSGNVNVFGSFSTTIGASSTVLALQQANTPWLTMTPGGSSWVQIIGSLSASIASSSVVIALQPANLPWLTTTPGASSSVQVIGTVPVSFSGATVSGNVNVLNTVVVTKTGTGADLVYQGTSPWVGSSVGTGAALSYQGGSWTQTLIGTGAVLASQVGTWVVSGNVKLVGTNSVNVDNLVDVNITGNFGQSNAAGSLPVVIATDQTTVPVSGNINVMNSVAVTGPATDAQLRAAALPVSGNVNVMNFPATQPVSLTGTQLVSGNVNVVGLPSILVTANASGWAQTLVGTGAALAFQGGSWNVAATQSGTWTVQPGNTPNTAPWLTNTPGASSLIQVIGTIPVSLSGSGAVIAYQGNNPWVSSTVGSGATIAYQGSAPWTQTLIGTGSVLASQLGSWTQTIIGTGAVLAFQGSNPWATSIIGTGSVLASQVGTWVVSGNVTTTIAGTGTIVGLAAGVGPGWNPFLLAGLASLTTVSSGACKLGGYTLMNLNSVPAYIQVWDAGPGSSITMGTTAPTMVIPLPCNSTAANGLMANVEWVNAVQMNNGIRCAATVSPTGSVAVTTPVIGTVMYK